MDSVAAVDWSAYETEATSAIAAATGEPVLDDARVKYLGRKSELAQALRGVWRTPLAGLPRKVTP